MKDRKGKIRERYDVKSVKDKCVGGEMIRRKTISIGTQFSYIRQELQSWTLTVKILKVTSKLSTVKERL